jgi:ParB-like chromosome segregation protein Spo0J
VADTHEDRRREPDEFSYRLGRVETQSDRNETELRKLELRLTTTIESAPVRFVTRTEFEKLVDRMERAQRELADRLGSLTEHLETFTATANASNAIQEKMASNRLTVRIQWPVWALMGLTVIVSLASLFVHH